MNQDLSLLLIIIAVTFAMFLSGRLRLDLVAMVAVLALYAFDLLSVEQTLAGFSHPLVLMIAGLFVVGGGLFRTGVADAMGRWLERHAGHSVAAMSVAVMLVAALLSAFISSTGTVAVLIPVVMALARARKVLTSKLMIPLAFGSLFGGMLTLIGTPPNLIVSAVRFEAGLGAFGFFDFTLPGLVMLVLGVAYFALAGDRLLPARGQLCSAAGPPDDQQLADEYGLKQKLTRLALPASSKLAGMSLADSAMRSDYAVTTMAISTATARGRQTRRAEAGSVVHAGDELIVAGSPAAVDKLCEALGLRRLDEPAELPSEVQLIESVVPPRSQFAGKTLRELRLHSGAGITVLAQRSAGSAPMAPPELDRRIQTGDALLITGRNDALQRLAENGRDLVLLGGDLKQRSRRTGKAPLAIMVMLLMLLAMTFNLLPNVIAVLTAAVAMLLLRCLTVEEALIGINWESVILIAAILPMATALENTGGMTLAADALFELARGYGPYALLLAVFVLTSGLSQLVSNTATTVLAAPIALNAATALQINPDAALMTVAIAASTAFLTPVASPVNTLVYNPGDYRFADFARVGLPLQILLLLATLIVVPLLFPLQSAA